MLKLSTPVRYIKGVGPAKAKLLNKLKVFSAEDLLNYFPKDWILPNALVNIDQMQVDKDAIIIGKIVSVDYQGYHRIPIMKITVADETGKCQCAWFNGGYLRHQLKVGQTIMLLGKVSRY